MYIDPPSPRFKTSTHSGAFSAEVPAKRNWFVVLFLCAWLGGWAVGELSAIRELASPTDRTPFGFLVFWVAGWTLGGAFAAATLLWQLAGRELVTITRGSFVHRIDALGIGYSRAYRASDIKGLRALTSTSNAFNYQAAYVPPVFGYGAGSIAFDFGARTVRIAAALDEAEAKLLVSEMESQLQGLPSAA